MVARSEAYVNSRQEIIKGNAPTIESFSYRDDVIQPELKGTKRPFVVFRNAEKHIVYAAPLDVYEALQLGPKINQKPGRKK